MEPKQSLAKNVRNHLKMYIVIVICLIYVTIQQVPLRRHGSSFESQSSKCIDFGFSLRPKLKQ